MLLVHGEQNNNKKSSVSHYMPLVLYAYLDDEDIIVAVIDEDHR
jgi:hypothetical protein